VGSVINAMSGIPVTERWWVFDAWRLEGSTCSFMPYNRGNLGRTPFLWFANLYAEYSLNFGKTKLNFNINVDNVFDIATTAVVYDTRTLYQLQVTEDQILNKDWELETSGYVPDPRFKKDYLFYPPISARLGVKFIF
jgi:hypothetical protein